MNGRKRKQGLLFLLFLPLLAGCWNMREMEHMFYAHAVGIEYKNGEYRVYVQILDFSALGRTEGGNGGGGGGNGTGAWLGRGTGKTLYGALHDLYASTQRQIYWGHLNTIVLSAELLEGGNYLEVLDQFTRFGELRYTPWIFATKDNVEELFLVTPVLERSPVYSQLSDPYNVYQQSSIIPPLRLHRFFSRILEPYSTILIPCLGSAKNKWEDEKRKYPSFEIRGAFFIQYKNTKGMLPKHELMGLRWMNKHTNRTPLTLQSRKGTVASLAFERIDPDIVPHYRNNRVFFDVRISAKGNVVGMAHSASEAEIQKMAEQRIRQEIMDTFRKGIRIRADVYNLMETAFRKTPWKWKKTAAVPGEFPLKDDSLRSVRIDVRIVHTGKNNKPLLEMDSPDSMEQKEHAENRRKDSGPEL